MIDRVAKIIESDWWVNGRLAIKGEFKANPLGKLIRIKYEQTEMPNFVAVG